jgi:hypothetical protein
MNYAKYSPRRKPFVFQAVFANPFDEIYLPDGTMARSNGDLVARARRLTEDVGRRAATVAEARTLLGITPPA